MSLLGEAMEHGCRRPASNAPASSPVHAPPSVTYRIAAEPDGHPKGDDVKIYSAAEHLIGHTRTAERAANALITARVAALRGRRV